ncbi:MULTISPECIES: TIGR03087 family PEP-CTERM/XrtA system glycosyltransferase [Thioalkalivibrio]|uniref:TIGR03087 family PEP-CTERM/XrtA system glycosyltransferase n=1 Tax=Thioalkalivibrio TaxID=106633 RepID=UPI0003609985|nr:MULTISPECIES: TIGR03087 family PEP-CTERM/XrtA system glycosyltransferase [Thioalkalivibrio]OOC51309.1 sugar transferase [Thioalkalivibrio versutus]
MDDLLYLVHRIPWPPNKGDKIRSHHILRYLAQHYRVHLGTFIDDPADAAYLPELEGLCASVCARPLPRRRAQLRALSGLLSGEALSVPWYRDRELARWVRATLARQPVARALAFSSAMAQYLPEGGGLTRVVDFVDVDSDKWTQYAPTRRWPMSAIYRREGRRLLAYERQVAQASDASLFVSPAEADTFREQAPEVAGRVHALNNGVDAAFFSPDAVAAPGPYAEGVRTVVFSGAMDYWPNVDAVIWFADHVLPALRLEHPGVEFCIVGSRPAPEVMALADRPGVTVTGFVDDVRPWIAHATVVIAPLRIARGVQNKVLEAMALARPVVASPQALEGLTAMAGREVIRAEAEPGAFLQAVSGYLRAPDPALGHAARTRVLADYDWARNLAHLGEFLRLHPGGVPGAEPVPEAAHGR